MTHSKLLCTSTSNFFNDLITNSCFTINIPFLNRIRRFNVHLKIIIYSNLFTELINQYLKAMLFIKNCSFNNKINEKKASLVKCVCDIKYLVKKGFKTQI